MAAKASDKKSAIFDATLGLISEQGLHATPMSQIAAKAKIGMGTIYHYFPSKDDLINALFLENKAKLISFITSSCSPDRSVHETFAALLRSMIAYYIQNPSELYFLEQCENSPIITEATKQAGMRTAGFLMDLFNRATSENLIKSIPFDILGTLLTGAIVSLAKMCLNGTVKTASPEFEAALEALWDMLKR